MPYIKSPMDFKGLNNLLPVVEVMLVLKGLLEYLKPRGVATLGGGPS